MIELLFLATAAFLLARATARTVERRRAIRARLAELQRDDRP